MESSRLMERGRHQTILPFTCFLAGPADYTSMIFNERRRNSSWAHQIASMAVFSSPLLTIAAHPDSILRNPAVEVIKSIPSVWDETIVLPSSRIGELVVYARRSGTTWYLALMNGGTARTLSVPLFFLSEGVYRGELVRDDPKNSGAVKTETSDLRRNSELVIELADGGGFLGRFLKAR